MTAIQHVKTAFHGHLFQVQVLTLLDGSGREITREVVRHPGAVLIVPILDSRHVVMIRNHRIAVGEALWEFPAGKLEAGEAPEKAAGRELLEETGYRAGQMRKIGEFYTSPGFTDELMRVFAAEDLTFQGQQLQADEKIEVEIVALEQAIGMVSDGRLKDGKSIAALLMWRALCRTHHAPQEVES